MIAHPLTGDVLDDDLEALVAAEAIVDRYLRTMRPHYAFRRQLRERIAELRGPAVLPRPRFRTDTQQRVSECARCGQRGGRPAHGSDPGSEPNPFHGEEVPPAGAAEQV